MTPAEIAAYAKGYEKGLDSLMTAAEVCDVLRVHHNTLARWVKAGRIPAIRLSGRLRFKRRDVMRVVERGLP